MSAVDQLVRVVNKIGDIASGIQSKLRYFVVIGVAASSALAFKAFDIESDLWWNALKCIVILAPALIWVAMWLVLNQLRDAPELVAELVKDEHGALANLSDFSLSEPDGLRGVFSTVREFRKQDGLEVIFDTIRGIALIANPLFAILAFLSMAVLLALILIMPFVLLF